MEVKGRFFHVRQSMRRLRTSWAKKIYETFSKAAKKGKPIKRLTAEKEPVRRG